MKAGWFNRVGVEPAGYGDRAPARRGSADWLEWNAAEVATLKRLLAEGLSASEIAAHLGCSRNAVIGKVARTPGLEFAKRGHRKGDPVKKAARVPAKKPAVVRADLAASVAAFPSPLRGGLGVGVASDSEPVKDTPTPGLRPDPPLKGEGKNAAFAAPVRFVDLRGGQCRMPADMRTDGPPMGPESLFCGAPVLEPGGPGSRGSFCADCHARCTTTSLAGVTPGKGAMSAGVPASASALKGGAESAGVWR